MRKRLVCGIGVTDISTTDINGYRLNSYTIWKGILRRCYTNTFPSYNGCIIAEDWKLFSNFKIWFDKYYIEGYELDKDLLSGNTKIYSENTCCFIPSSINKLFTHKKYNNKYYVGISFDKSYCKYKVRVSKYAKQTSLGYFNTKDEAHEEWLKHKIKYCCELAISAYMNNEINERIMNAIIKKAYELI